MLSDSDLYESLESALWALGIPTRNLVISTIESRGVLFRPQAVDIGSVDKVLIELFGIGSKAIIGLACRRFKEKMVVGFDESRVSNPVEKIKMWLEVNSNREQSVW